MGDGLIAQGDSGPRRRRSVNRQWDGIWIARVSRTPSGWTAEIELPFRTLNFDPTPVCGASTFSGRCAEERREHLVGPRPNQGLLRMTNAGRVTGLAGMSQGAARHQAACRGVADGGAGRGRPAAIGNRDVGVDVFYSVTLLRANFTVNTDSPKPKWISDGQPHAVSFVLPEKREFFLRDRASSTLRASRESGRAGFQRRIGLDANGNPQKIDVGLKLTGQ